MSKLPLCYYFLLIIVVSGCITQPVHKGEILIGTRIENCIKKMGNNWSLSIRKAVCSDTWKIKE